MKTAERPKDGSAEDIEFSYGIQVQDQLALEKQASLRERQLTKHRLLGRILMRLSGNNPARVEQQMRDEIAVARQALPTTTDRHPLEAERSQVNPEQPHESTRQQPAPQPAAEAPTPPANNYYVRPGTHR